MSRKDIGRPRKRLLDHNELKTFALSLGFTTVEKVMQPWRHAVVFGTYAGQPALLKTPSTQKTSPYTENEYNWNEAFWQTDQAMREGIIIPKNLAHGLYKDRLFCFIMTLFPGDPLIMEGSPDTSVIEKRLDDIVQAAHTISSLKFPKDSAFFKKHPERSTEQLHSLVIEKAKEWAQFSGEDCNIYIDAISADIQHVKIATQHGDFAPRQLFDIDGEIGIIDGEHASPKGLQHYDAAWFFLRLYFDHQSPQLAHQFMQKYLAYGEMPRETRWHAIKPLLLQKLIGDMWGGNDEKKKKAHNLGRMILEDAITS